MHCNRLAAFATLVLVTLGVSLVQAQPQRIPSDIVSSSTSLNAQQREVVAEYVRAWAGLLTTGSDAEVTQARIRLMDPMTSLTVSAPFSGDYAGMLVSRLQEAMKSDRVLVRMNAVIVARYLRSESAAPVLVAGLNDANEGVIYLAGQAAINGTPANGFSPAAQQQLLQALSAALTKPLSPMVLEQVFFAQVELTIPEATASVLNNLNSRIDMHIANANTPMAAERQVIERLFPKLVRSGEAGVDPAIMTAMAKVNYRYQLLAARLLDRGGVSSELEADYIAMIRTSDLVLDWVVKTAAPQAQRPGPITTEIDRRTWAMLQLRADNWRRILIDAPFSVRNEDLTINLAVK